MIKDTLTLQNLIETCHKYQIPYDATIELATGWECSEVPANEIYYSISDNTLYLVSQGCEDWFEKADIIHLDPPSKQNFLF